MSESEDEGVKVAGAWLALACYIGAVVCIERIANHYFDTIGTYVVVAAACLFVLVLLSKALHEEP